MIFHWKNVELYNIYISKKRNQKHVDRRIRRRNAPPRPVASRLLTIKILPPKNTPGENTFFFFFLLFSLPLGWRGLKNRNANAPPIRNNNITYNNVQFTQGNASGDVVLGTPTAAAADGRVDLMRIVRDVLFIIVPKGPPHVSSRARVPLRIFGFPPESTGNLVTTPDTCTEIVVIQRYTQVPIYSIRP